MIRLWQWPVVISAVFVALTSLHVLDVIIYSHTVTMFTTAVTVIATIAAFEMRTHLVTEQNHKKNVGLPAMLKALRKTQYLMVQLQHHIDAGTPSATINLLVTSTLMRLYFIHGELGRHISAQSANTSLANAIYALHMAALAPIGTDGKHTMTTSINRAHALINKAIAQF